MMFEVRKAAGFEPSKTYTSLLTFAPSSIYLSTSQIQVAIVYSSMSLRPPMGFPASPLASANPLLPSIDPRMIDFYILIGKRGEVRSRNPRIHALPSSRLSTLAAHFLYFLLSMASMGVKHLICFGDAELINNRIRDKYMTKNDKRLSNTRV